MIEQKMEFGRLKLIADTRDEIVRYCAKHKLDCDAKKIRRDGPSGKMEYVVVKKK